MHILGKVYGALLQSIAMKNHVLVCRAPSAPLQTRTLTLCSSAGSARRFRLYQRPFKLTFTVLVRN